MKYGSVCSGIEAATAAWHPLGWEPAFFSEIENFPRAVLKHHYPDVPLHGDFTTIGANDYDPIDLLVGGTPCQSFSIAGLRGGMDDERGNLALEYLKLVNRKRPTWLVWENVPGVLSSWSGDPKDEAITEWQERSDFACFLNGLSELGYGWAYRILDAQYFGVPQRRRRVFVVGYLGDRRRAGAVLFERQSLSGDIAPSRAKREIPTGALEAGIECCHEKWINAPQSIASTLDASYGRLQGCSGQDVNHGHSHLIPMAFGGNRTSGSIDVSTAVKGNNSNYDFESETFITDQGVRRLTVIECERLQGFADNFTQIAWGGKLPENCPDGHRYQALGNSMAVPCMSWIGQRIESVAGLKSPK